MLCNSYCLPFVNLTTFTPYKLSFFKIKKVNKKSFSLKELKSVLFVKGLVVIFTENKTIIF